MTDAGQVIVRVCPTPDGDADAVAGLTLLLRAELLGLDVRAVDTVAGADAPRGAKGVSAVAGWLVVHLGSEGLLSVLAKVADWAFRNDRMVEVSSGGDVLKLARATPDEQEKIINAWLAQHAPGP